MAWFSKTARLRLAKEQTVLVFLVIAYIATGRLGLRMPNAHPAVSLVWPPAGIALGAFVVLGYRVWPAVLAGAGLLYATTIGPLPGVLAMAAGNTVEGLLTAY